MGKKTFSGIRVFYEKGTGDLAAWVSYGIEEEGLPFTLIIDETPENSALMDTVKAGLGVAVSVREEKVCLFCRQLKEKRPFMVYGTKEKEALKRSGKNAARIIKHKPFILLNDR